MNERLLDTLRQLPSDPTVVVSLYQQLFDGHFWVLAQKPTGRIEEIQLLTYPTSDGTRELPVFASRDRGVLADLSRQVAEAEIQEVEGPRLWARMLQLVDSGTCFVAVDPGEKHGIRLTKEMILGMVSLYAAK